MAHANGRQGGYNYGAGHPRPAPGIMPAMSPLSQTLWRDMANTDKVGDTSARLTWVDLWVTVVRGGVKESILQGLTGYAEPGSLMAIMGPSGSGKSTLLDTLAGRLAQNATQTGQVLLNGRRKTTLSYGTAAYVTQTDDLIGTLTVRETIYYSANLRLPSTVSRNEKKAIVDSTIQEMGLFDCRNTPVGNWHLRGLSGGEKRRLSIALEILTRPRLLFLDEPTSGLDSFVYTHFGENAVKNRDHLYTPPHWMSPVQDVSSRDTLQRRIPILNLSPDYSNNAAAFFVITTLRNLARDGRTIIASIHQPSSEVFELFDNLTLLSSGRLIYFGQASNAIEHFTAAGFPCPTHRNPSDHFLRAVNADFDKVKSNLKGSFKIRDLESVDLIDKMSTHQVVRILNEAYQSSQFAMETMARIHEILQLQGTVLESGGSQAGFFKQCLTLTRRSFTNMSRDMGYYWLRLVIYITLSVCLGSIYFQLDHTYGSILSRAGCIAYVGGFLTFMSIGGFPSFVEDMKVFNRERLNGHYGVLAFVVGNTVSSLPFLFLIALVSSIIVYFMARLHPGFEHFAYFVLSLFAQVAIVESLMMAVASLVPNFLMGIICGAGIQGIFMLVAGFFRLVDDLPKPVWRYPLSYVGFDMYALQGMYINEFMGLEFDGFVLDGKPIGPPIIPGWYVVRNTYGIRTKLDKWDDLAVLFGMIFIYRIIFFVCIKLSENLGPFVRSKFTQYRTNRKLSRKHSELQNVIRPVASPMATPQHDTVPLQYNSKR